MILSPPERAIKFLQDYTMDGQGDRVVDDTNFPEKISSVILKTLNCRRENNYYIKPGQLMPDPTIVNAKMTTVYSVIKALKKLLSVKVSNYGIKKIIRQKYYEKFAVMDTHDVLFQILSQPEIKAKFEDRIDYDKWGEDDESIFLKEHNTTHNESNV